MLIRFFDYYERFIKRFFFNKYNYINGFQLPKIDIIYLSIVLNNVNTLEDIRILESINLLSYISLQKPEIFKLEEFMGGKKKLYKVIIRLSLRGFLKYNFLDIFYICFEKYYNKKYYKIDENIKEKNNSIIFLINDLNFFFFIREFFVNYKEVVKIEFILKNKKKNEIKDFFSFLLKK